MTEQSQVNDYNENKLQREAVLCASQTIQHLSSLIARISTATHMVWIENDLDLASKCLEELKKIIPPPYTKIND